MSRTHALIKHPKRTLAALGLALAAVGVAVGSGASFGAQTANPSNTFSSGTLTMSNSKDNLAVLTAANMKPGDSATGTVDIANTGSLDGTFSLSRPVVDDSDVANPMSQKMNLVVRDCGTFVDATAPVCDGTKPQVYAGTIAAMTDTNTLGTYTPSDKHRYEFVATFDPSVGDVYQGASTTATFQWNAVQ
ncbi:MAG: spore coat-associated protein [Solirubrobacteraceae bacterium]|jgi:hypothetical protein|nr:spore coat-associated protein [Solirubrobacteraceae bacterium]